MCRRAARLAARARSSSRIARSWRTSFQLLGAKRPTRRLPTRSCCTAWSRRSTRLLRKGRRSGSKRAYDNAGGLEGAAQPLSEFRRVRTIAVDADRFDLDVDVRPIHRRNLAVADHANRAADRLVGV